MTRPLAGWRVLVPRGGRWGDGVAAAVRSRGATAVVAPLINFAVAADPDRLAHELRRLEAGEFDWLVVSSATTVDVLVSHGIRFPEATRVAAIGETTAQALAVAGYRVDVAPQSDSSARSLVREWPPEHARGRALVPHSESTDPTLEAGLARLGLEATFVSAYRTVGVAAQPDVVEDMRRGRIDAALVTSGSVAREVAAQLSPLPDSVIVVCIGPRTAFDARAAGLPVHIIAEERSAESMLDALAEYAPV